MVAISGAAASEPPASGATARSRVPGAGVRLVHGVIRAALSSRPVERVARALDDGRVRVLAYHDVRDPARFTRQMEHVLRRYTPISLSDLVTAVRGGPSLSEGSVLVTFDDGEPGVVRHAAPILSRLGIPAVAFVLPGLVGTSQPFWWREVEELLAEGPSPTGTTHPLVAALKQVPDHARRAVVQGLRDGTGAAPVLARQLTEEELRVLVGHGVEVGNHTLTHPCLPWCSDEVLRHEITAAHSWLADRLGAAPRAFAYPNGDSDERTRLLLEQLGYDVAFLFDHRLCRPEPEHRLELSRIRVDADATLERFVGLLSGAHSAVHHWRGRT